MAESLTPSNLNLKDTCLQIIHLISENEDIRSYQNINCSLEHLSERLNDNYLRIAVVGEFSSGKSTFINAILGKDILKHGTTETTATITRITNVEQTDPRIETGTVHFRDGNTAHLDHLSKIDQYTTTKNSLGFSVAEQIEAVDLYMPILGIRHGFILIDTPGLNGTASGHREQTLQLVQQSHACIYLMKRGGLGESDRKLLQQLAEHQKRFIFVQNFIDDLSALEGDTLENIEKTQNAILKNIFEGTDITYQLCGVSALKELVSRDHSIERLYSTSTDPLSDADRQQCHLESNFDQFRQILAKVFNDDTVEMIQYGDSAKALFCCLSSCIEIIEHKQEQIRNLTVNIQNTRELETLKNRRDSIPRILPQRIADLQNTISLKSKEVQKEYQERLRTEVLHLMDKYNEQVGQLSDVQTLKEESARIHADVSADINRIASEANKSITFDLNNFYNVLILQIQKYPFFSEQTWTISLPEKFTVPEQSSVSSMAPSGDSDYKEKQDIQKCEEVCARTKAEISQMRNNQNVYRDKESYTKQYLIFQKQCLNARLAAMGPRPEKKAVYGSRSVPCNGLFGWLGFTKEVSYTTWDDSQGQKWDNENIRIKNDIKKAEMEAAGEIRSLQRRIQTYEKLCQEKNTDIQYYQQQIETKKRKIKEIEENRKLISQHALDEYLQAVKNDLIDHIKKYLFDGEQNVLDREVIPCMNQYIQQCCLQISEWARKQLSTATQEALKQYDLAIAGKDSDLQKSSSQLSNTKELLLNSCNQLKEVIN